MMTEIDDFESVLRSDTPLIDTRSPTEFAKGSLPAAVNLPLMNNEEREAVGGVIRAREAAPFASDMSWCPATSEEERVRAWQTFANGTRRARCFASVVVCDRRLRSMAPACGWISPHQRWL